MKKIIFTILALSIVQTNHAQTTTKPKELQESGIMCALILMEKNKMISEIKPAIVADSNFSKSVNELSEIIEKNVNKRFSLSFNPHTTDNLFKTLKSILENLKAWKVQLKNMDSSDDPEENKKLFTEAGNTYGPIHYQLLQDERTEINDITNKTFANLLEKYKCPKLGKDFIDITSDIKKLKTLNN